MARLIVNNTNRGSRFFIVPICTSSEMCRGVTSTRLTPRSGTSPLDFSITSFNHVLLPDTALVASDISDLAARKAPLEAWWDEVWRIQLGTLSVPAPWINATKMIAYIGGRYSMWRCITGKGVSSEPLPILAFRTQQWPIAHATAVGMVMDAWYPRVLQEAMEVGKGDGRVMHALAVVVKATVCRHFQRCVAEVAERCGAQWSLEANYMARIEVRYIFFSDP